MMRRGKSPMPDKSKSPFPGQLKHIERSKCESAKRFRGLLASVFSNLFASLFASSGFVFEFRVCLHVCLWVWGLFTSLFASFFCEFGVCLRVLGWFASLFANLFAPQWYDSYRIKQREDTLCPCLLGEKNAFVCNVFPFVGPHIAIHRQMYVVVAKLGGHFALFCLWHSACHLVQICRIAVCN